jgi:uncharacterized protein YbjT (DUF2867 family)
MRNENAFNHPAGDSKVSFIEVIDIASVAAKIHVFNNYGSNSHHMRKAYSLIGDELLTYKQAAEIQSKEAEKK